MESEEDKIIKAYYNPSIGLWRAKNLYLHFNKKITLIKIKNVLDKIKNKQIIKQINYKENFIPIVWNEDSYQMDLTFFTQYKIINNRYTLL